MSVAENTLQDPRKPRQPCPCLPESPPAPRTRSHSRDLLALFLGRITALSTMFICTQGGGKHQPLPRPCLPAPGLVLGSAAPTCRGRAFWGRWVT